MRNDDWDSIFVESSRAFRGRQNNDEVSQPCEAEEKANMTDFMHLFPRSASIKLQQ